jgi:peptide/nickel transport system substrate-binding protein
MAVPDPDIFYETEGLQVTLAVYEGLLEYDQSDSAVLGAKPVPLLAKSYTVSPDGLTYTFVLRDGLKFADGSPVDSSAVEFSFERRTKVNQGPAYMLAQVDSYDTPDPSTFVVHLKQPVSAFLDYMASPYGPKIVNPAIIQANEVEGDSGQQYLQTHSAGTGPFEISDFQLGTGYTLTRNPNYWGTAPALDEVDIKIIPDAASQQLQLEQGDLDVVHNFPKETLASFQGRSGFQVISVPSLLKQDVKINPNKAPFDSLDVRTAFRQAIDRNALVDQVWGSSLAKPSTQMLPTSMLPDGMGMDQWTVDPSALATAASSLSDAQKDVQIVHQIGLIGDQQMAEALQAILLNAGFNATVKAVPITDTFAYRDADPATVPNIVVQANTPDGSHPETYGGIYYRTDAFLNFLKGGSPQADALMNQGLAATTPDDVNKFYGQAKDQVFNTGTFVTIADEIYTFIASDKLKGFTLTAAAPTQLNLRSATLCG